MDPLILGQQIGATINPKSSNTAIPQISTFSDSRSDLALSAALDIISAITHILMLVAVIAWSAQPGAWSTSPKIPQTLKILKPSNRQRVYVFVSRVTPNTTKNAEFQTYYDGGTCQTFMKLVISDPETCTRAAREVFGLSFDQPMYGGNRTGEIRLIPQSAVRCIASPLTRSLALARQFASCLLLMGCVVSSQASLSRRSPPAATCPRTWRAGPRACTSIRSSAGWMLRLAPG